MKKRNKKENGEKYLEMYIYLNYVHHQFELI